jgi:hypothetical protein
MEATRNITASLAALTATPLSAVESEAALPERPRRMTEVLKYALPLVRLAILF